jgi:transient receptor potential cation channel subfamily A member 1
MRITLVSHPTQSINTNHDISGMSELGEEYRERNITEANENEIEKIPICSGMLISGVVIFLYILTSFIREVIQVCQQRYHYLLGPINFVSWLLYLNALIMISPIFTKGHICDFLFSAASLTVFLSWFNLLLHLQRFDQVGIYVVMFLEILQTLIKVLAVFSILIIAFGLAFYILLSSIEHPQANHVSFTSIPMSLMRTFTMMLGEINFVSTFVQPLHLNYLPFPYASFTILCEYIHEKRKLSFLRLFHISLVLFMILMPILLMNLLIGLAVGDIESVRRNAQLKRLAMQVCNPWLFNHLKISIYLVL